MIAPDFQVSGPWAGWRRLDSGGGEPSPLHGSVIVSLCNVAIPGFTLAVVDLQTLGARWLCREAETTDLNGSSGLLSDGEGLWVLHQKHGKATPMSCLDANLRLVEHLTLDPIFDGHDLRRSEDGSLWIADTGHDRIAVRSPQGDWRTAHAEAPGFDDTRHLNSLALLGGQAFATVFGPKSNDSWRDAHDGRIVRAADGKTLVSNVSQPHSLIAAEGSLWWCESARSEVRRLLPDGQVEIVARLKGYLRGLLVTPDHVLVCASGRRLRSRHVGVAVETSTDARHLDDSLLYAIDRRTGAVSAAVLSHLGLEAFALVEALGAPRLEASEAEIAAAERAAAMAAAQPEDQTLA